MNSNAQSAKKNKATGYYEVPPVHSIKHLLLNAKNEAGDWDA